MLRKLKNMVNTRLNQGRLEGNTYRKRTRRIDMTTYGEEITFLSNNSNVIGKGSLSVDYPSSLFKLNIGVYNGLSRKDRKTICKSIASFAGKGMDCNKYNCHVININIAHPDENLASDILNSMNNYICSNKIDAEISVFEHNQIVITRP